MLDCKYKCSWMFGDFRKHLLYLCDGVNSLSHHANRDDFDPALLQPGFEPPHYELCTLRRAPSGDLADAGLAEDFDKFHKLRRSESKCIRDHHCGSHHGSLAGSIHGSRSNLSLRDATIAPDGGSLVPPLSPVMVGQLSPHLSHQNTPAGRRSILVIKHSYSQDGPEGYRGEEEDDDLMVEIGHPNSQHHMHHHQTHHGISGLDHTVHRTLSNDFWFTVEWHATSVVIIIKLASLS